MLLSQANSIHRSLVVVHMAHSHCGGLARLMVFSSSATKPLITTNHSGFKCQIAYQPITDLIKGARLVRFSVWLSWSGLPVEVISADALDRLGEFLKPAYVAQYGTGRSIGL